MANIVENLEERVFLELAPTLEAAGFREFRAMKQFRRPTQTGFQNILLSISGQGPYVLEVHLGIRSHMVEELLQQFVSIPLHFAPHATTLHAPLYQIDHAIPRRFRFDSEKEVAAMCEFVLEVMQDTGFDYFEEHSAIDAIDRVLNEAPDRDSPFLYNQLHRCFRGLIVAKMAQNLELPQLIDTYHKHLERKAAPQSLINRYERLAVLLHNFSLN
ncbi:MAG TPA: hypothetical protein DCE41_26655 [Cytophagales bacterium]|nr:hypothetical protein [Cytophagales bacterium]